MSPARFSGQQEECQVAQIHPICETEGAPYYCKMSNRGPEGLTTSSFSIDLGDGERIPQIEKRPRSVYMS